VMKGGNRSSKTLKGVTSREEKRWHVGGFILRGIKGGGEPMLAFRNQTTALPLRKKGKRYRATNAAIHKMKFKREFLLQLGSQNLRGREKKGKSYHKRSFYNAGTRGGEISETPAHLVQMSL